MAYVLFIASGFVLVFFSWLRPRYARVLGAVLLIFAIAFAGLRGDSMDYGQYVIMFHSMHDSLLSYPARLYVGKDPLFGALIVAIQSVGLKAQWLFVAAAVLALALKARAFTRVFGSYLTPLFVTVCLTYFIHEFTQIRVAIALGFSFMALVELCQSRRLHWIAFSALAVGFHASALFVVALELPFILGINKDKWIVASGMAILSVLFLAQHLLSTVSGFEDRVAVYIGDDNLSDHMLIIASFKWVVLTILTKLLLQWEVDPARHQLFKICYFMQCMGFGVLLIFMDRASGLGFRIYEMLDAFSVFIVAAGLLRKKNPSWGIAISYCMAMLVVLSVSKLLLPYDLANQALW